MGAPRPPRYRPGLARPLSAPRHGTGQRCTSCVGAASSCRSLHGLHAHRTFAAFCPHLQGSAAVDPCISVSFLRFWRSLQGSMPRFWAHGRFGVDVGLVFSRTRAEAHCKDQTANAGRQEVSQRLSSWPTLAQSGPGTFAILCHALPRVDVPRFVGEDTWFSRLPGRCACPFLNPPMAALVALRLRVLHTPTTAAGGAPRGGLGPMSFHFIAHPPRTRETTCNDMKRLQRHETTDRDGLHCALQVSHPPPPHWPAAGSRAAGRRQMDCIARCKFHTPHPPTGTATGSRFWLTAGLSRR
jgi:hypothetical protein